MSTQEMSSTAREYRELQNHIKTLEKMADALKQRMIREMAYQSSRLDTAQLRKELPDVADRYSKSTTSTRFSVA